MRNDKIAYQDFDEEKLEKLRQQLIKLADDKKVDGYIARYVYDLAQYLRAVVEKLESMDKK